MAKQRELSPKAKEVLDFLIENGPSTIAEMKEKGLTGVNSAHLTALRTRNLVHGEKVEKEIVTVAKRKVLEYSVIEQTEESEEETE